MNELVMDEETCRAVVGVIEDLHRKNDVRTAQDVAVLVSREVGLSLTAAHIDEFLSFHERGRAMAAHGMVASTLGKAAPKWATPRTPVAKNREKVPKPKAPSREGKIALTVWVDPQLAKLARVTSLMVDQSLEKLMESALYSILLDFGVEEMTRDAVKATLEEAAPGLSMHLNAQRKRRLAEIGIEPKE